MAKKKERHPGIRMIPKGDHEHTGFRLVEYCPGDDPHDRTTAACMDAEVWVSHIPAYFAFVNKCWKERYRPMFNWHDEKLYLYAVHTYKGTKEFKKDKWRDFIPSEILLDLHQE